MTTMTEVTRDDSLMPRHQDAGHHQRDDDRRDVDRRRLAGDRRRQRDAEVAEQTG